MIQLDNAIATLLAIQLLKNKREKSVVFGKRKLPDVFVFKLFSLFLLSPLGPCDKITKPETRQSL